MNTKKQIKFLKKEIKKYEKLLEESQSMILQQNYFSILSLLTSSFEHTQHLYNLEKGVE